MKPRQDQVVNSWRLLPAYAAPIPLRTLRRHHIQELEDKAVREATVASAATLSKGLATLAKHLDYLSRHGVVDRFLWSPSLENKQTLNKKRRERLKAFKEGKAEILDRQIEALSEATSAMLKGDERLDKIDHAVIALMNILICAPSRVNEALTLKIDARFTIEDYVSRPEDGRLDNIHSAHQLLLMKGSKGAAWSPKPILNFMIMLVGECWRIMLDAGKRSRALVTWYQQHPDKLYLPAELEHLRGKPVSAEALWHIVNLTSNEPSQVELSAIRQNYWSRIVNSGASQGPIQVLVANPRPFENNGRRARKLQALQWLAVEAYLLKQVHGRMSDLRNVTPITSYKGRLSEMLALVDLVIQPYLPNALNSQWVRNRLKTTRYPSVFAKLGLRMSQGGTEVECYLGTHDPRRWLTTQALAARERLSDVLINKWANRMSLGQLQAYDLRSNEQKAEQAATPLPSELVDMSQGLQALEDQASQYGLSTEIVVAHGTSISVTSMEAVTLATEGRPVARTGGQILILYPTRFGACVHQHHETPCRSYVCGPCGEQRTVKGHLPTNEEWRKEEDLTYRSIVNQLQSLVTARNRGIADDPQMLDSHLLALVKEGLSMRAMANELIDRFLEIKDQIRDLCFRNELEQAFVARGIVNRLDDPEFPSGALIKYHNPKRHAAPGHELALESHFGSREEIDRQSELFYQQHPDLAPANLRLQDECHLLADDDNNDTEGSGHDQAA